MDFRPWLPQGMTDFCGLCTHDNNPCDNPDQSQCPSPRVTDNYIPGHYIPYTTISRLWISPKVGGPLYPRCEYPQKSVDHFQDEYPRILYSSYTVVHNECTATDNLLKWSVLINNEEICTDKQTNNWQLTDSDRLNHWLTALTDWLNDWLTDCPTDYWLTDWLILLSSVFWNIIGLY